MADEKLIHNAGILVNKWFGDENNDGLKDKNASAKTNDIDNRFHITMKFVEKFFCITALIIFACLLYNGVVAISKSVDVKPIDVGNIISLVIGQLGASLAIIVGFYFQNKQQDINSKI